MMPVYFMQAVDGGTIKIGCSVDVERRRKSLESYYKKRLTILRIMEGDRETEREIHARFARLRLGKTEQFQPDRELLEFIGCPSLASSNDGSVEAMEPIGGTREYILAMRGTPEYHAWLLDLRRRSGYASFSDMLEAGLSDLARNLGIRPPPPRLKPMPSRRSDSRSDY